jgi:sec-independent protein translocase protein TatC
MTETSASAQAPGSEAAKPRKAHVKSEHFNPEDYRMTFGEHLEELRWRLILALLGFALALVLCLVFGDRTLAAFCKPYIDVMYKRNLNPQMFISTVSDGFMVFIEISVISAVAISAPWIVYQLWQFVAAGLYPHERKYVTRYVPLSITLLIAGMVFVYWLVLPWTIMFFIDFSNNIPLPMPGSRNPPVQLPPGMSLPTVPILHGDPSTAKSGEMWFNSQESRLKMYVSDKDIRVIPFGPSNLLSPHITLPDYIDLVVGMLLTFGLSFQLPLVVLALARIGILPVETLKSWRKYVYFSMSIIAAAITPGDVITATIALMVPLCLLYELGILLAQVSIRRAAREDAAS